MLGSPRVLAFRSVNLCRSCLNNDYEEFLWLYKEHKTYDVTSAKFSDSDIGGRWNAKGSFR